VTEQREDKEFEAFLAGESELADRYTALGSEEPPSELDAHILAAARNAAKIRRIQFGPRGGWLKPVALAATVLLAFSLVMNVVIDSPTRDEQVITELMETTGRHDADVGVREMRSLVKNERAQFDQPTASSPLTMVAEDRESAIEEITVAVKKLEIQDNAEPVSLARSGAFSMDPEAALLIVAKYVAAAGMETGVGRAEAEADAMEQEGVRKAARAQKDIPASVAADQITVSGKLSEYPGDEYPGDNFKDSAENGYEDNGESLLRDIERLSATGDTIAAVARLDEFLVRYPDHPVSIRIHQQGY